MATVAIAATLAAGIGVLAYPSVSDWWNALHQTRAYSSYVESLSSLDEEEYGRIWERARRYNERLAAGGSAWASTDEAHDAYMGQLQVGSSEIVAYLEIEKIGVSLPVYLTAEESVLQVAAGHLEGSSLPVGGESTHTVLTGHRGLPSARLFTDLDKLEPGDLLRITVLDRALAYRVEHVEVVTPGDTSSLCVSPGQDLCTLVTCTPYGINTHRLLVHARRADDAPRGAIVAGDAVRVDPSLVTLALALPLAIAAAATSRAVRRSTGRGARKRVGVDSEGGERRRRASRYDI